MNQMLSLSQLPIIDDEINQTMVLCNEKTQQHGLSLNKEEVVALTQQRNQSLFEVGRVEFGRGPLVELASAFVSSPYLNEETYAETLGELQGVFYQLKEDIAEDVSDEDLIEAMRTLFDEKAHGSLEFFEGMSSKVLLTAINSKNTDDNADWSEEEAYREKEQDDTHETKLHDETDRVYEQDRYVRPDNRYADNFYDGHRELYRSGFDHNSRIGGSSL